MRYLTILLASLIFMAIAAFTSNKNLVVTSPAFNNNSPIPIKYTCLGQEVSPPLSVKNIPAGAKSLVVIVDDPDAKVTVKKPIPPAKTTAKKGSHKKRVPSAPPAMESVQVDSCFLHWLVWNIDVDGGEIPEGFKNPDEGLNGMKLPGYKGMCPPTGAHHYHFKVYALDTKLNISKTSTKEEVEKVMEGHILGWGELVGIFDKLYK